MTEKYKLDIDVVAAEILDFFSNHSQMIKTLEELAECSARIAKDIIEGQIPPHTCSSLTIDEIADATLMLRQMRLAYGYEEVDRVIDMKLQRMINIIEN